MLQKNLIESPLFTYEEMDLIVRSAMEHVREEDEVCSVQDVLNWIVTETEDYFYIAVHDAVQEECVAYSFNG